MLAHELVRSAADHLVEAGLDPCEDVRRHVLQQHGLERAQQARVPLARGDVARALVARRKQRSPRAHADHPDDDLHGRGSWSLKAVLPTVAPDLDYGDLDEAQDGVLAQVVYEEAIAPETSPERRETIRRNLLRYCERDTLAMMRLVEYFQ